MQGSPHDPSAPKPAAHGPAERTPVLKPLWWTYLPVAIVAFLGVLITNTAFVLSLDREQERVAIAFNEAAQDRVQIVQREIDYVLAIVQDLASFFDASATVGRREFRKFVGPALKRYAGIKALQWVPVVSAENRPVFVAQAQRSFPPFRITDPSPDGGRLENPDRTTHYPVLYVQPYSSHKDMLGRDMAADPTILPLLEDAERAQEARVSTTIFFEDDTGGKKGFAVAIPVFQEEEGNDEAEGVSPQTPAQIRGFALGFFYIKDVFERAVANLRPGGVDLHLYHDPQQSQDTLLHTHYSRLRQETLAGRESVTSSLIFRQTLPVAGQRWEIVCNPAPGRFETEISHSWIILAAGLAFTTLLTTYLVTLVGQARRVRHEVDVRTFQLWETVQDLNREITERKSAEQDLQNLNETLEQHIASRTAEAERRAQYLEQFAYVASHDLKAPLRAVSNLAGWIEEDLNDKLDDASQEQLNLLRDRVQRMHNLIEGLLEYSRVGKTSDTENDVDTRELITEIVDSLSPPKGFKIKIQREMPTIFVDRLQLGQVFSNLVSNSLKYHGATKGKIWVTGQDLGSVCEFSVCDDGQGIAPEYHEKIFMMFQTLESGDFENSTGIGLALVKKIVEEHGGTIRVESDVGKGACFYFTWPKKRSAG